MATSLKGITIHEGYNDIGTFEFNVTPVELPSVISSYEAQPPKGSRKLLFRYLFDTGEPVTQDYLGTFTVLGRDVAENTEYTAKPDAAGYLQIDTPILPVVVVPSPLGADALLRLDLNGPLDARAEECYMEVTYESDPYYTLIRDLFINPDTGKLSVQSGSGIFYDLASDISIDVLSIAAVHISAKGVVYGYDISTEEWSELGTLEFTMIQFPDKLTVSSDGFYFTNAFTGTVTPFTAGTIGYEDYAVELLNPGIYLVDVEMEVSVKPGGVVYTHTYTNLMPGDLNITIVTVPGSAPVVPDDSPTIEEIATLTGITFTEKFLKFLESHDLETLEDIRKVGPIDYINGFNPADITESDLKTLQGHVSFYAINKNVVQNQRIISQGYKNISIIAFRSRKTFMDSVVNADLPFFEAAKFHELAVQNQKLTDNLTAGILSDLRLASPSTPEVAGSHFVDTVLGKSLNSCGCDDCKSIISPFAYLFDLLKYGAAHVQHMGSPTYLPGSDGASFINLMATKFLQPFNSMAIDCKTLHDEFCRVRLVTEVLEKKVLTIPPPPSLVTERNQFFQLVYQTILLQAGTSMNEVRTVYLTPAANKLAAAQKLSDKLGIPLYVPSTTDYTVDVLWLTIGNTDTDHELTALNLEEIFGFRDTQRDVLTNPLEAYMEKWHAAYLRDFWRTQDYVFTSYSREGVVPGSSGTYKNNWLPIIDPDIMGWEDMTYLGAIDDPDEAGVRVAIASKELWKNRKAETDRFLYSCVNVTNITPPVLSVDVWADIKARILKVTDEDIVNHVLEGDVVYIKNPSTYTWDPFPVNSRTLNGTDTDVSLEQSFTVLYNPLNPKMMYKRVVPVEGIDPIPTPPLEHEPFVLTWAEPVIKNATGTAKLVSSAPFSTPYFSPSDFTFTVIDDKHVQIEFLIEPDEDWLVAPYTLIYDVEVNLYADSLVDPVSLVPNLFDFHAYSYNPLSPAVITDPYPYTVWDKPVGWAGTYDELKALYNAVSSGLASEAQLQSVSDNLHLGISAFNRLMVLMSLSEKYLASMFTAPRPTIAEQYEMASIIYTSAKTQLRGKWVEEEIEYVKGIDPIKLRLSGQHFWKALSEPDYGAYDPSLQTIPDVYGDLDVNSHRPIIDPLFLAETSLCVNPEAKVYRDLYHDRKDILDIAYSYMFGLITPYFYSGFDMVLNYINTGDKDTAFSILPYLSLPELVTDLTSMDPFAQKKAGDIVYSAFGINAADFLEVYKIKTAYEDADASKIPAYSILAKAIKLLLPGYARIRLYFGGSGWIKEEIDNNIKYYNVRKLRMASGRGNTDHRKEWQNTLAAWNRQPFVQPDLVPPENIKDFESANVVYTMWNDRYTALLDEYSDIATVFKPGENAGDLLTDLRNRLNVVVSRSETWFTETPGFTYLPYFLEIADIEDRGDDIRPNLALLGIKPAEYRFLMNIYKLLESETFSLPSSMVPSEFDDTINILIAIRSRNLPFNQVQEEFEEDILLDQDYFLNYKPALVSFPQADLPVYNQWRSPQPDRKAWADLLQSRIDQEQGVKDRWAEVLKETEDRNLPLMRDALIRALTAECQAWQDKAEELAKTYFIETKDNCCVMHTRVSFAIETVQGFLNALSTGVFAGFIEDFKIQAPAFRREWEWLGSYATWRAAMFVYMYPENLLYPTLKRLKSPAFIKLADTVQNANRFSPTNACDAAQQFQTYFEDIKNLDMCCTVNTNAYIAEKAPNDCCAGEVNGTVNMIYYFAKGSSGTAYWSKKEVNNSSKDAHSFWEELPVRKTAKLIGCFVYTKKATNQDPKDVSLLLFYSYSDKGKFKVSYIRKSLSIANSSWSEETETDDFPSIAENDHISVVTACQSTKSTDFPAFVLSYTVTGESYKAHSVRHYNPDTDKWIEPKSDAVINSAVGPDPHIISIYSIQIYDPNYKGDLITSVRFDLTGSSSFPVLDAYAYVLDNQIIVKAYAPLYTSNSITFYNYHKIHGVFQSTDEDNTIIVFYEDGSNVFHVDKIKLALSLAFNYVNNNGDNAIISQSTTTLTQYDLLSMIKPYPVFAQDTMIRRMAFGTANGNILLGADIAVPGSNIVANGPFAIAPERSFNTAIQSAECIKDMHARTAKVKDELLANTNAPEGTSINAILRTTAVRELLYEAYYFVSMLLALDQQKRGEYQAALDWYSSVYDFRNAAYSSRKVFYGLVLEESFSNTVSRTPDWLLDPLNPHLVAQSRAYAYSQYTITNIVQCLYAYADREFTLDTIETVPLARRMYTEALELLKVRELNLVPNGCEQAADACIQTKVTLATKPAWQNLLGRLKQKLRKLGSASLIDSIETEIVTLLNSGSEETYPEKFTEAFELIDETMPAPEASQNVLQKLATVTAGSIAATGYFYALNDYKAFNERVIDNFTETVAKLSGLSAGEVGLTEAEGRIAWLSESLPYNLNEAYEFSFDTDGMQHLAGSDRYNPLEPTRQAYEANLVYTNANSMSYRMDRGNPKDHVPMIPPGFCMPKNPVYQSLQLKGNVETYKILNCRNIAGMVRELEPYAAATDSTTGMPFIGAGGNLVTPGIGNYPPVQYRFRTLIERAKQIVAQAQQMESLFLAALEKLDNENYSQLRARQDLQTARATVKLQDLRITQAKDERGSAQIQLDKATFTQEHYNDLFSAGENAYEIASLILLIASAGAQITASALSYSSTNAEFDFGSGGTSLLAQALSTQSSILSQLASFQRRQEEWGFQKDLAGFDISLANQQIKIAEDNVRIVTQERDIAQMNTDHAADSLEFLKTKFTNAELYNYMSNVLERSYSYMLNLATSTAKIAERQLYFERQEQAGPFILNDYWEAPTTGSSGGSTDRRGLTGSARLTVDITRLDQYAFETNKRKLQMTKVISLAQNFPSEFQQFKETGIINFGLTNKLFDYDFPGHYLRLINSVKTSVIALVPVYDSIKATLTAASTSYTVIGGTIFQRVPIRRSDIDSVALTSAGNATGVFEMQPVQSELMNPFENMGIESQWEFKLPRFSNRMDYSNIADVLLTVEYTAFDSFLYRTQVLQDLDNSLSFNRGFSFKNDFPDQWYELADVDPNGEDASFGVTIELKRELFPQGILDLKMNAATGVKLYFARAEGYTAEITVEDFNIVPASAPGSNGDTINGMLNGSPAMYGSLSPLLKLKLMFDNTSTNRALFSEGKVTDILLLVGCKAELYPYPL